MLDDRVDVDREIGREPYAAVLEWVRARPPGLVQLDHRRAENRRRGGAGLARLVDHVHLVRRHGLDDVDATRHQLGDLGGLLGDDADAHVLVSRLGPPVVLVANQQVLLFLAPLHELVGPRADRVLLHPLVALLLDDLLGLHHLRGEPLDEQRIGAVGLEARGEVVRHLHALDLGVVAAGGELVLRVQHPVEGRLDVLRPERRAVVKLHALAQLHFPRAVVDVLPRHREARPHLAGLEVAGGEVIEDVVAHDDALAEHRVGWVPVLHVALNRVDDRVVLGLRREIDRSEQSGDQHEHRSQRDGVNHDALPLPSAARAGTRAGRRVSLILSAARRGVKPRSRMHGKLWHERHDGIIARESDERR